jgi:UDP-glucose 4-epimerase
MNAFVTGAAGFIGSNLVDRLLAQGHTVTGFDNFSTGHEEFLAEATSHERFRLERGDVLDFERLRQAMDGADFVFHLAANADVRFGTQHPRKDLEQNTIATWNVIEAMRHCGIRRLAFSSTGSVYGEPDVFPTPENCSFPIQTSLYAASKLAAEGMIEAYCEGFGMQAYIFRLVSVLGPRYSHGHVIDFYAQLREHPDLLNVLGDGRQRKSYLHVEDCVSAILYALEHASAKVQRFNLGTNEYCEVNDSIRWITDHLGVTPHIVYSGGERGWTGDSPFIFLDCSAIRLLGWQPQVSIREAVVDTLKYLGDNSWVLPAAQRRLV